jgi:hypothetical protein
VYRHFLFSEGCACDVCDQPHLPSSWLGSQGDYSLTVPAAPSLRLHRPLHNLQSLTFCNLMEIPTARFITSNLTVYLAVLLNTLSLPRHSCYLAPRFFIPLSHSGPFGHLFSSVHPLWLQPLCCAGTAQWVIHLWATANFFWNPTSPWVHFLSCWQHLMVRRRSLDWSSVDYRQGLDR